mgnify:CR=1 FL=1
MFDRLEADLATEPDKRRRLLEPRLFVPLTAQLVTDLVFDRAADPALEHLKPSRFGNL